MEKREREREKEQNSNRYKQMTKHLQTLICFLFGNEKKKRFFISFVSQSVFLVCVCFSTNVQFYALSQRKFTHIFSWPRRDRDSGGFFLFRIYFWYFLFPIKMTFFHWWILIFFFFTLTEKQRTHNTKNKLFIWK